MPTRDHSIMGQRLQPLRGQKRPLLAWMSIGFAGLCALMICAAGWIVFSSREVRMREARLITENMARMLAAQATMEIKIADVLLEDIVERVRHEGSGDTARSNALTTVSISVRLAPPSLPSTMARCCTAVRSMRA